MRCGCKIGYVSTLKPVGDFLLRTGTLIDSISSGSMVDLVLRTTKKSTYYGTGAACMYASCILLHSKQKYMHACRWNKQGKQLSRKNPFYELSPPPRCHIDLIEAPKIAHIVFFPSWQQSSGCLGGISDDFPCRPQLK